MRQRSRAWSKSAWASSRSRHPVFELPHVMGFTIGGLVIGFACGAWWMEARWQRWRAEAIRRLAEALNVEPKEPVPDE